MVIVFLVAHVRVEILWQTSWSSAWGRKGSQFKSLDWYNHRIFKSSEALRQTNLTMKERFEGLTAWREKQRQERDFLESRLAEARSRMEGLTLQNQELSRRLGGEGRTGGALGGLMVRMYLFFVCVCVCSWFILDESS